MTLPQHHGLWLYRRPRLAVTALSLTVTWKRIGLVRSISQPLEISLEAEYLI